MIECNFCNKNEFNFLFKGHDYLSFSRNNFKVKQCKNCGIISLNPRPKDMMPFYSKYHSGDLAKDSFSFLSKDMVKLTKRSKRNGKVLDIGCGKGKFLFNMKKTGWDVYGNELSSSSCEYAKNEFGLKNVFNGDLLSLDLPANFFDLITLWHVLEHLDKPHDTLNKIYKLLKENGLLIIESPNFCSIQSRIFKDKWFSLDLPRHLYQFSPSTLKKCLNKSRFEIVKRDYIVNPRINFVSFKISLLRWLGIQRLPKILHSNKFNANVDLINNKTSPKFLRFLFNFGCLIISLYLNLTGCDDSFRVYCKKNIF